MKQRLLFCTLLLLSSLAFAQNVDPQGPQVESDSASSDLLLIAPGSPPYLYPNPAQDNLYLDFISNEQADRFQQFQLYNFNGQIVGRFTEIRPYMDIQYLAQGLYYYRVVFEGEEFFSGKLLVH